MKISNIQHNARKEKWYYDIYDIFLDNFPETSKILEIGVQSGESLKMWQKLFPKGEVVGIDIDPNCGKPDGTTVYIGDQVDKEFLQKIVDKHGRFDVIVDDGGHTMEQQIKTFEFLFPYVKSGGLYVIEDLHTSYWAQFGGAYKRETTTIEYLKGMIDHLNEQSIDHPRAESNRQVIPNYGKYPIGAMHFYTSLVFIEHL